MTFPGFSHEWRFDSFVLQCFRYS